MGGLDGPRQIEQHTNPEPPLLEPHLGALHCGVTQVSTLLILFWQHVTTMLNAT